MVKEKEEAVFSKIGKRPVKKTASFLFQ